MLTGKERIEYGQFFKLDNSGHGLRGHSLKLFQHRSRLEIRKHIFSQRVISSWNKLPQQVIDATSTNAFKNRYGKYIRQDRGN